MSAPPRESRGRLSLVAALGAVIALVIGARLTWVQLVCHDEIGKRAAEQHFERERLAPHRGAILDRNQDQLAYTADNPTLIVDANRLTPAEKGLIARQLSKLIGVEPAQLEKKLNRQKGGVVLNPKATALSADELADLPPDVIVEHHPKRIYRIGSAAAHLTGYVGVDQEGLDGIEKQWDELLRGQPGWTTYLRDARGNKQAESFKNPPVPGSDLILSIDAELQQVVAERLDAAVEKCNARGGYVLVIEPKTGDILALANSPSFDPTWYDRPEALAHQRNRVVADGIEPGSTIKAITSAAALEDGSFRPNTPIDCHMGHWMLQGKPITDHEGFGVLPFIDTFAHSSNVAMAQIGLKLGPEKMYHYLRKFGFAEKTNIGLPGESPGSLKRPENWSGRTAATVAFGYEIRVSPIQMAMAYAALANGGILMKPRLVRATRDPDGTIHEIKPVEVRRAVTEKTAATMLDFMKKTVAEGTGRKGAVEWCTVGGKTGTARKYDPTVKGYVSKHYASFVGVAPVESPRLLCYAVIDEPKGEIYGGSTAAPLFREILEAASRLKHPLLRPAFRTIDVAARPVVAAGPGSGTAEPKRRLQVAAPMPLADAVAETIAVAGELKGYHDAVAKAAADTNAAPPELLLESIGPAPELVGMSFREATQRASAAGYLPRPVGDVGVVVRQFPAPGAMVTSLHRGTILLFFDKPTELADHAPREGHDGR